MFVCLCVCACVYKNIYICIHISVQNITNSANNIKYVNNDEQMENKTSKHRKRILPRLSAVCLLLILNIQRQYKSSKTVTPTKILN